MYLQLGWRNIWRNPRRTLVIMTAVIIGVWSMIFLGSLMRGVANQMVRNGISTLTGHIQVHRTDYQSDPVVENSMTDPGQVAKVLERTLPDKSIWSTRVRVNAVASNARHSTGVTLVGIDPEREAKLSFIGDAVTAGRYLRPEEKNGIILGKALADKFETKLHRKVVLMSQDTTQEIASMAFRIVGIFSAEMKVTEEQFVFVSLVAAQKMLKLDNGISEISILLPDHQGVDQTAAAIRQGLDSSNYEVHTWRELLPMATAVLKLYDWFIFVWFLVIFIAMGFGIVNTMLMAVFERIREFGLVKALGMKPWGIIKGVLIETSFLLIIGMIIGNALGFLTVFFLADTGIDLSAMAEGLEYAGMSRVIFPVIQTKDVTTANLVVFVLGLAVSIYPALKAARFKPVKALAHT